MRGRVWINRSIIFGGNRCPLHFLTVQLDQTDHFGRRGERSTIHNRIKKKINWLLTAGQAIKKETVTSTTSQRPLSPTRFWIKLLHLTSRPVLWADTAQDSGKTRGGVFRLLMLGAWEACLCLDKKSKCWFFKERKSLFGLIRDSDYFTLSVHS